MLQNEHRANKTESRMVREMGCGMCQEEGEEKKNTPNNKNVMLDLGSYDSNHRNL